MIEKYDDLTVYNFGFNNPVTFSDPSGADPIGTWEEFWNMILGIYYDPGYNHGGYWNSNNPFDWKNVQINPFGSIEEGRNHLMDNLTKTIGDIWKSSISQSIMRKKMLVIKSIIKEIEIMLKDSFQRKRNIFFRHINDVVQVIEIQKYSFMANGIEMFTINVGIIHPIIFERVFNKKPTVKPAEGILIFNVGEILNNFNNRIISKDWAIENEVELLSDISDVFYNSLLPFLDLVKDSNLTLSFLKEKKLISKQVLSVKMQINELEKILQKHY